MYLIQKSQGREAFWGGASSPNGEVSGYYGRGEQGTRHPDPGSPAAGEILAGPRDSWLDQVCRHLLIDAALLKIITPTLFSFVNEAPLLLGSCAALRVTRYLRYFISPTHRHLSLLVLPSTLPMTTSVSRFLISFWRPSSPRYRYAVGRQFILFWMSSYSRMGIDCV